MANQPSQVEELRALLKGAGSEPGLQDAIDLYQEVNKLVQANNELIYQAQFFVPTVVTAQISPSR